MLKVGLTGGIASGKTYVAELLRELGCEVTDADQVARAVVEPGQPAYEDIVKEFGPESLQADGTIDRARLSAIIFTDADKRAKMNAIVHPRIHEAQNRWMAEVAARNPAAIVVVDAALLIESGGYKRFDKIVVVHCAPDIQLARLMVRNNLSYEEAAKRIAAQMPTAEKLKYADYSIDTSGGFEPTRQQVIALYAELKIQAGLGS
ncbi:MAG TPA: dephospho-CoA kinase [Blastocatellia bacterium]|nr:dephospho-CoA kinase [Blastocatellia bacterium]